MDLGSQHKNPAEILRKRMRTRAWIRGPTTKSQRPRMSQTPKIWDGGNVGGAASTKFGIPAKKPWKEEEEENQNVDLGSQHKALEGSRGGGELGCGFGIPAQKPCRDLEEKEENQRRNSGFLRALPDITSSGHCG